MKKVQQIPGIWMSIRLVTLFALLFPTSIMAQSTYKLMPSNETFIKVFGTSNVHDWTMTSMGIESQGIFKFNQKGALIGLSGFSLTVQATSLKSGKSSMDNRTYNTLLADEFPKIVFQLKTVAISQLALNRFMLQTTGNLTIAGTTQPITMNVTAVVNSDNSISCSGTEKLKLTDYKIVPPSFMLGAMKVGNDLTIKFELNYNKLTNAK